MNTQTIESFTVIGISTRTTNENGQSEKDIPALWNKFMSENILQQIPNKIDETIYCIYTDYEADYTKPYTTVLGCKVSSVENVPNGMTVKTFEKDNYSSYVAKGNILQGMVFNAWLNIWNSDLPRAYNADFEVYDERAQNPENAEVDIFISIK